MTTDLCVPPRRSWELPAVTVNFCVFRYGGGAFVSGGITVLEGPVPVGASTGDVQYVLYRGQDRGHGPSCEWGCWNIRPQAQRCSANLPGDQRRRPSLGVQLGEVFPGLIQRYQ